MVSRVEETLRRKQQQQVQAPQAAASASAMAKQIQCNNIAKYPKFKRSSSNVEEDGASSAMLLLACIAFAPDFSPVAA